MQKIFALLASFALFVPSFAFAASVTVPPPVNTIIPGQAPAQSASQTTGTTQVQPLQSLAPQQTQSAGSTGVSCSAITGPLGLGSSGQGVTQLQQFLAQDPSVYPEAIVSGYFGSLTQTAVQRFQAKNGIVSSGIPSTTGYGRVGPKTLAAIQAQCGGGSAGSSGVVGAYMQVSPVNGTAPLSVQVVATVNAAASCAAQTYAVDFGEGDAPQSLNVPAGTCAPEQTTLAHTYLQSGVYTITISSGDHQSTAVVSVQ